MEKVVYCLRRPEGESADAFRDRVVNRVAPEIWSHGMDDVEVHVSDSSVEPAAGYRVATGLMLLPDALISGWVPSANDPFRAPYDEVVTTVDPEWFGYVVSESLPLPGQDGGEGRATGYSQIAFLRRPQEKPFSEWIAHWHGTHTDVAMETQSTTRYVQNLVVRPLTEATPELAAIVEEVFPDEAMTDSAVFFDSVADPERQKANVDRLFASVGEFLDFAAVDVVPMSRYFNPGPRGQPC